MNDDLISQSALLIRLAKMFVPADSLGQGISIGIYRAIDVIGEAPAVDAVEVVHCRDCNHWMKDIPGCTDFVGRCELANYMVGANGYCVYGERMVNE